ncbi:CHASE2 domain-containing protein [Ramlibacter sp. MMS24-I3-19]|uniref:CHASE2 domain-containing protein n=1 Tax=Ramlibacter sp. MMS24-I3-19 TaxID=3416606 RepID=UPI003CFD2E94
MALLAKHWIRIAVTMLPVTVALLHAGDIVRIGPLERLDNLLYDARLRATMPRTLDSRIVIVDIDEKSLADIGRWPWSRNLLAELADELFDRQKAALLGFDVVFAERDESSGLKRLRQLAQGELKDQPAFARKLQKLQASLDYDALFARALDKRPVVLGYYFTSDDREGRTAGLLPAPVMDRDKLQGRPIRSYSWNGYGANIDQLSRAAPFSGFINPISDQDGVVRAIPLLADYKDRYYEPLALAMFRLLAGSPTVEPGFPRESWIGRGYEGLESVQLKVGQRRLALPVDHRLAALIPYRGYGGPKGGSFRYVSASDIVRKRLAPGSLEDKIVLVGTTAPGLQDLHVTPVGDAYPGVEAHANLIAGMLDSNLPVRPDYAVGVDVALLLVVGLVLVFVLPVASAGSAVATSVLVMGALVGLNFWLYIGLGLVMPLAAGVAMTLTAFALNMSYGYFIESRSKRELANLFGTYVPPELVDEMVKDPDAYTMKASNKELTVMFCDMRGFTKLSERMEPVQLQELLNAVFNRLTDVIRANRGTIDKYMGDCVMAFWGAPVETAHHAQLAVKTSLEMAQAVHAINQEHRAKALPEIGVGIGLNTGTMCVGDMGSDVRRSYTVIGDSVNLGSRLEGLSKVYGVEIVVSERTKGAALQSAWQELDRVRVKGKEQAVGIFTPLWPADQLPTALQDELRVWGTFLEAYRAQDWDECDVLLRNLRRMNAKKYLYELYSERVASMRLLPFDPSWDGATTFETK